jgi:hypothetical protein
VLNGLRHHVRRAVPQGIQAFLGIRPEKLHGRILFESTRQIHNLAVNLRGQCGFGQRPAQESRQFLQGDPFVDFFNGSVFQGNFNLFHANPLPIPSNKYIGFRRSANNAK